MPLSGIVCSPASSRIAAGSAIAFSVGASLTAATVTSNVSVMLYGVPLIVFVAVSVIVVVPLCSAAGTMVNVRVGPRPATVMFCGWFGTSVVLPDDAVTVSASPTLNRNTSGVSSAAVLSVTSSIVGSASKAPMSVVGIASA